MSKFLISKHLIETDIAKREHSAVPLRAASKRRARRMRLLIGSRPRVGTSRQMPAQNPRLRGRHLRLVPRGSRSSAHAGEKPSPQHIPYRGRVQRQAHQQQEGPHCDERERAVRGRATLPIRRRGRH